eukprot:scaffold1248_cov122-Isochrysis_galbana.AAC.8
MASRVRGLFSITISCAQGVGAFGVVQAHVVWGGGGSWLGLALVSCFTCRRSVRHPVCGGGYIHR